MTKAVEDRGGVGVAVEPVLRDQRVENDESPEQERKPVDHAWTEREPASACGGGGDARERDGEQDLLPGRDHR
jgi:hypothetical protein